MAYKKVSITYTTLLASVFFASGFVSLIYQVVWQRLLTLHYGVGAISITLIVSIYMAGLGIGALCGGFLAERVKNRMQWYFWVEFLIGCFGLISLPFLNFLGHYTAASNYVISFLSMSLFLCVPTCLMGLTLPLLIKIFNSVLHDFFSTVSYLYFINTIGAAVGAYFSSYVLISFFGLDTAIYFAATLNFIIAFLILLARYIPVEERIQENNEQLQKDSENNFGRLAYLLVFVTGFLAIGYEIIWFRIIGILIKASPYAFSTTLSVYLFGIAFGSYGMNIYLRHRKNVRKKDLFFMLQFLIGTYVMGAFIAYYYLTQHTNFKVLTSYSFGSILHPPILEPIQGIWGLYLLFDVLWWPMIFVLIPTLFMGASFPLISSLALSSPHQEGKTVGTVYFFTISGNVLGGVLTGFLLLPQLGSEYTLLLFSSIGIFWGLFVISLRGKPFTLRQRAGGVCILLIILGILFPKGGQLYKTMHLINENTKVHLEEGVDGVVITIQQQEHVSNYINGLSHGGHYYTFYVEAIEALAFAPKVKNILIIGFGTGSFVETTLQLNEVRNITLIEINEALINNLKKIPLYDDMLSDNRLRLIIDDGRRFLLQTQEKFDLIMMDPLRTTTAYSNNLYSYQFFELIEQHLTPEGAFLLWTDELNVLPKTLISVFDYARMYDFFCLASNAPFENHPVRQTRLLKDFLSPGQIHLVKNQKFYRGDQTYIQKTTLHYPINQDWKPVCEYYLGLKLKENLFYRKTP